MVHITTILHGWFPVDREHVAAGPTVGEDHLCTGCAQTSLAANPLFESAHRRIARRGRAARDVQTAPASARPDGPPPPRSFCLAASAETLMEAMDRKMKPAGEDSEPRVPTELRKALATTPLAKAQ